MLRHWLPVLIGMACFGCGIGLIGVYGFFVPALSQEFGVGAAIINLGPVALLLVPAFISPTVGKLVDRVSIRRLMLLGIVCSMGCLALASQAPALWLAALGFLGFAAGVTLYGPVVVNGLMVKLYPAREGRALAIVAMGVSVSSMLLPPLTGLLLAQFDWRTALLALVSGLFVFLFVLIWMGIPAGAGAAVTHKASPTEESQSSIYRQLPFWLIGFCVALALNVSLVLAICYPPHFVAQGFTVAQAGWFLSIAGFAGITGKALFALVADFTRQHVRWLAAAILLIQALGMALLPQADDVWSVLMAVLLVGFGTGAFIPMHPYLNSRYFDAGQIGQVNGAQVPLMLPFGLVGAPLAGLAFDRLGNYELVLQSLCAVLLLAALLALVLPASSRSSENQRG
tara:strand:- start:40673 stop:41866 length:1194 start_codon:yes stop_codon:yes gene_type:complete